MGISDGEMRRCLLCLLACTAVLAATTASDVQSEHTGDVSFLQEFSESPAEQVEETHADTPYKAVTDVEEAINEAQKECNNLKFRSNDLYDDEMHAFKHVGDAVLMMKPSAEDYMTKRYNKVREERLALDQEEVDKKTEITALEKELVKVKAHHEIGHKAFQEKDQKARLKWMNEKSHKNNIKEEAAKSSAEQHAKNTIAEKGARVLQAQEKKETEFKTNMQKEMIEASDKKTNIAKVDVNKAKAVLAQAQSKVEGISELIKATRVQDAYANQMLRYRRAVVLEKEAAVTVQRKEAKKKVIETGFANEKAKFFEVSKAQKAKHVAAKENHQKLVSGRQSQNCDKSCKLYRIATDSSSKPERGKSQKKNVCFSKNKEEAPGQVLQKKVEKQVVEKQVSQASQVSQVKNSGESTVVHNDDFDSSRVRLGEAAGCQGQLCSCTMYMNYHPLDPQGDADRS